MSFTQYKSPVNVCVYWTWFSLTGVPIEIIRKIVLEVTEVACISIGNFSGKSSNSRLATGIDYNRIFNIALGFMLTVARTNVY